MYLLFDIGGTKTRIAQSRDPVSFDEPVVFLTPQDFEEAMALYKKTVMELMSTSPQPSPGHERVVHAVAGGVPGIRSKEGALIYSPNLRGWEGRQLRGRLQEALGAQELLLENDASLVGLGEAMTGAGKGYDIVAYVTVSTGVGGGKIVRGVIDPSAQGFEPGHQLIDGPDGPVELESVISGRAVHSRFGKHPKEIPQNDPLWDELAKPLAQGLHNLLVTWSPDVLVLGGSMIVGNPAILVSSIERELAALPQVFPKAPLLKKATLGDFGGLWGALTLLRSNKRL